MKKLFKSMNDSQYRFSLRKMSVGVCSVVLGLSFAGMSNAQVAKADTVVKPTVNQQVQTKDSESSFTSIVNVNSDKAVSTQDKVAENSAGVKASAPTENEKTDSSKVTDKIRNNIEKIDKNLNNAQSFQESTKTTIFNVSNFAKNSDQDRTKGLLESKAIHSSAGWENRDGKLYYRDNNGEYLKNQWAAPTGTIHYFGREGYIINNQLYTMPDKKTYYFDNTGHTVKNRWYTVPNDSTYYFDDKGAAVKDRWFTLPGGQTYYFDSNGHTIKNRWYEIPGCWINYYFDNDGHTVKNRWYTVPNDSTYYFDDKGDTVRDRWFTLPSGQTYYFDSYGHTVRNRWYQMLTNNGINYYFDADGHTIRSRWYTVPNDSTYYFDDKGAAVRDRWFTLPGGQTYYFDDDGRIVRNRVYDIDDVSPQYVKVRFYYFDSNGHSHLLKNTWLNYDRYHMTYYLDNQGAIVANKWYTLPDGQTYYFGSNSYPVKNSWYTLSNGQTYYFDSNGHTVKSRYYTLNGVRHWFDKGGKTSFKSIDNISYEGLKLNTKDYMTVSGKAPAGAKIYVKSPLESVKYGEYKVADSNKDGDFQFDPSIWSGQTITILIKDKNGKEIVQRKQLYVPFLTLKNWSYDSKNGILSGSKNGFVGSGGDSIIFQAIVDNQTYDLFGSDNNKFDLNIGQYAGHTVTIITFSNLAHTEVAPRKVIKVPPLHFSEIKVNRYGIEGKILGCRDDISVIAEDPVTGKYLGEGNTGSYIFETGRFDISLPESYYGKKVKLIVDSVIGDDLAKGEPFELYIPELKDLPEE